MQYTVHAIEPYDFARGWKKTADKATKALTAKPAEWKIAIWKEIKGFLFLLSHGKCGYCEGDVRSVSSGEVEHYRPKGGVSEDPTHSGYWWLAYNFTNYVPTCSSCNTGKGKRNQFPIEGVRVSLRGDDLSHESPLLLNPFSSEPKNDPTEHIQILVGDADPKNYAMLAAKNNSPLGQTSREVYNLNRGDILVARRRAMESAEGILTMLGQGKASAAETLKRIAAGHEPYSAAQRAKLKALLDAEAKRVQALRDMIGG
jgi:hypothetical protein